MIDSAKYSLNLQFPILVSFISLRHILHELHEFSHMIVGRFVCGVWGTRDFNNVHPISERCVASLPAHSLLGLEGPLTNYLLMWIGVWVIRTSKSVRQLSWGLVLIFATLPFARLFTAIVGGGDEFGVARAMMDDIPAARIITICAVLLIIGYPVYTAYSVLPQKHRLYYFFGFLLIPMIVEGLVVLGFFNYLLRLNILNEVWVMGAPQLVAIVLMVSALIFIASFRYVGRLIGFR